MQSSTCLICKESDHSVTRCPTLVEPLKEGFFTGGPSQGSHSHDDEETLTPYLVSRFKKFTVNEREMIMKSPAQTYTEVYMECSNFPLYSDLKPNMRVIKACQIWRAIGEYKHALKMKI